MDKIIDLALFSKRQQEAIITQDKHPLVSNKNGRVKKLIK